ncbi:MAG: Ig-like domain-containing protein [Lachnospiraceae bacterium]|nr:Ig-like domain-containing protein [Lachnospiraceae bacterium]
MKKLLSLVLLLALTLSFSYNYSDVATVSAADRISIDKCKVTISGTFYYTGVGVTPTPKVTYNGKKLVQDKDFTVYYKNNVQVGVANVTLVGINNYSGSTTTSFTIEKGLQKIRAKNITAQYGDPDFNISASAPNPMTYKSSNKKVATINSAGIITIKKVGKTKITIKAAESVNTKAATKTITLTVGKGTPTVEAYGDMIEKGSKFDVKAKSNSGGKLTFSSSNKSVATISKKGIVTAKKVGETTITVKCAKTKNYKGGSTKVKITVY